MLAYFIEFATFIFLKYTGGRDAARSNKGTCWMGLGRPSSSCLKEQAAGLHMIWKVGLPWLDIHFNRGVSDNVRLAEPCRMQSGLQAGLQQGRRATSLRATWYTLSHAYRKA